MKRPLLLSAILLVILTACAPAALAGPTTNPNLLPARGLLVQFDRGGAVKYGQ